MPKLTYDEIETVKFLISQYSNLWNQNNEYSRKLEELSLERDSLVREIENLEREMANTKEQERILEEKLRSKYGNFKLDMETFEIFIED